MTQPAIDSIAPISRRAIAYLIDALISGAIGVVGVVIIAIIAFQPRPVEDLLVVMPIAYGVLLVVLLGWFVYYTIMQSGRGSIGMRAQGLRLSSESDGAPIGFGRALLRNVVFGLSAGIIVGYFTALFDGSGRFQGWHDKAAKAVMLDARKSPSPSRRSAPGASAGAQVPGIPGGPAPTGAPAYGGPAPAAPVSVPPVPLMPPAPLAGGYASPTVPAPPGYPAGAPAQPGFAAPQPGHPSAFAAPAENSPFAVAAPPVIQAPPGVPGAPGASVAPVAPASDGRAFTVPSGSSAFSAPVQPAPAQPVPAHPEPAPFAAQPTFSAPAQPTYADPVQPSAPAFTAPAQPDAYAAPSSAADPLIAFVPGVTPAAPVFPAAPAVPVAPVAPANDPYPPVPMDSIDSLGETIVQPRLTVDPDAEAREAELEATRISIPGHRLVFTWDDGTRVPVSGRTLFGRNPAHEHGAERVAVRDETLSLSKTHFEAASDVSGGWVLDRHSTNGMTVVRDGERIDCPPGQRVPVRLGDAIEIGDRIVTIGGYA